MGRHKFTWWFRMFTLILWFASATGQDIELVWKIFDQYGDEISIVYDQSEIECSCKTACDANLQIIFNQTVMEEGNGKVSIQVNQSTRLGAYNCQLNNSNTPDIYTLTYRLCAPGEADWSCTNHDAFRFCLILTKNDLTNICGIIDNTVCKESHTVNRASQDTCKRSKGGIKAVISLCSAFAGEGEPTFFPSPNYLCTYDEEIGNFQLQASTSKKDYAMGEYVQVTNGTFIFETMCSGTLNKSVIECQTKLNKSHYNPKQNSICGTKMLVKLNEKGSYVSKLFCTANRKSRFGTTFIFLVSMDASVRIKEGENGLDCYFVQSITSPSFKQTIQWKYESKFFSKHDNSSSAIDRAALKNGTYTCTGLLQFFASSPYFHFNVNDSQSINVMNATDYRTTKASGQTYPMANSSKPGEKMSFMEMNIYFFKNNTIYKVFMLSAFGMLILSLLLIALLMYDRFAKDPRDFKRYNKELMNSVKLTYNVILKEKTDYDCKVIAGSYQKLLSFTQKNVGTKADDQKMLKNANVPVKTIKTCCVPTIPRFTIEKLKNGPFANLHLSCVLDLYKFNIYTSPGPKPGECEAFWKFIVEEKIGVSVCLELAGANQKLFQYFLTTTKRNIWFDHNKYRLRLIGKRFRALCSVYTYEIEMNEKVVHTHYLVTANKINNVYPLSVNDEIIQKKFLDFISVTHCVREHVMESFGYKNSGMIVVDGGEVLKAPSFVLVFIARQLLLQYGQINLPFLFQYIRRSIFGSFTWSDNAILQVGTTLTFVGNFARQFIPEELPSFWVTAVTTRAEHKFFLNFQTKPEDMFESTRVTQHYKSPTKWITAVDGKDLEDKVLQDYQKNSQRHPFRCGKGVKGRQSGTPPPNSKKSINSQITSQSQIKSRMVAGTSKATVGPILKENSQF